MHLQSIRLCVAEIEKVADFYQNLTGVSPQRPAPGFAVFNFGAMQLALSDEALIQRFNAGVVSAGGNAGAIIEFMVDDVDSVRAGLAADVTVAMEPADMPWGNRSMLLRDPDGNAVNVFSRPKG